MNVDRGKSVVSVNPLPSDISNVYELAVNNPYVRYGIIIIIIVISIINIYFSNKRKEDKLSPQWA